MSTRRLQLCCLSLSLLLAAAFSSPAQTGVVINEVLANSDGVTYGDTSADWVELFNTTQTPQNLGGAILSDSTAKQYVFPAGTTIAARGYLVVPLIANSTNAGQAPFGLKSTGDTIYLKSANLATIDVITFGFQVADLPVGRFPDGGSWTLCKPTPAAANESVPLGNISSLRINEWMADPASGEKEFTELFNTGDKPVLIAGCYLSDKQFPTPRPFAPHSYLGVGLVNGFIRFWEMAGVTPTVEEVDYKLGKDQDHIYFFNPQGTVIDHVTWQHLQWSKGDSEGRQPDGGTNIVTFVFPTPNKRNIYSITSVVINELLAHVDPPFEDAIELYNVTDAPVDIGGWYLSCLEPWNPKKDETKLTATNALKFKIPAGTIIPPKGYKVFYEQVGNRTTPRSGFNTTGTGDAPDFTLNSAHGGAVWLTQVDSQGQPEAVTFQDFAPSPNGYSLGRHLTSDGRYEFVALSAKTFGQDKPATTAAFRKGTGLPNAAPLVGSVVINEVMYNPPTNAFADERFREYIEIYNASSKAVPMFDPVYPTNRWKLRDAVSFTFPANTTLQPREYVLLVAFDPTTNANEIASFRADYGLPASTRIFGPYQPRLDNTGASVELCRPDPVQLPPHPDAGYVPYILADKVKYKDKAPWPISPDGDGASLQRTDPTLFGDEPTSWKGDAPTPGTVNGDVPAIARVLVSPLTQMGIVGQPVSMTVHATGDAPLRYTWLLNKVPVPGGTNATLTIPSFAKANAGTYTVLATNIFGAATSAPVIIRGDFVAPVATLLAPKPNAVVSNTVITVSGKVTDDQGTDRVEVRVGGGEWLTATLASNLWSYDVTLTPGATNLIEARAIDFGQNASKVVAVKVIYPIWSPLSLEVGQGGTVSGAVNGGLLLVGKQYTLTAKPSAGYLFSGWEGDIASKSGVLKFTMQTNLALKANFLLNPFLPVKGQYQGLFQPALDLITASNAGFCQITLAETGRLSGQLKIGVKAFPFTGNLALETRAGTIAVAQLPKPPIMMSLQLLPESQEIVGFVTNGTDVAELRAVLTVKTNWAGRYTWLIPGNDDSLQSPGGDGAGTINITAAGLGTVAGALGDSSLVNQGSAASVTGEMPVYVSLYKNTGMLIGWLQLNTTNQTSSSLFWLKPANPKDLMYTNGFSGLVPIMVSPYRIAKGQPVLDWTLGTVVLSGGELLQPLTNQVTLTNGVFILTPPNPQKISLKLNVTDGTLAGTFIRPGTTKTVNIKGVTLPATDFGGGWFSGTNHTGNISLEPAQ